MGASQLSVYSKALRWLEERQCLSLTEPREPVRLLNTEWQDAVNACLYTGFWNFAVREIKAIPDSNQVTNFGYTYSYTKPPDWVRTFQISQDDRFHQMLRRYLDQNNVWFSDLPYMYIKYVSNDPDFGWNMAYWTPGFTEYLAGYLASLLAPRIKQDSAKIDAVEKRLKRTRAEALSTDAMDLPVGHIPYGTWVTSRMPRGSIYPFGGGWDNG